jgi:D-threo-aldose 1-dehydrogenase
MSVDFPVPTLGLGAAPLGATGSDPFAVRSASLAQDTVRHCLARDIRFFDTAPLYGAGLSESRLGDALADVPRSTYLLESKVGVVVNADGTLTRSYARDMVLRSVEQSLARLRTDHLDMALIHDADDHFRGALEEAYPALADLKAQGVVRAIGAGMNQWQMQAEFARSADFDCFLLAGRYTLLEQEPLDEYLPLCLQKNISVFLGGVFNTGILATGARPGARYQYADAPPHIMERVRRIEAVCARHGVQLKSAALQFPLAHPAVKSLVLGMVSPQEIDENLAALHAPVPPAFWQELRTEGLVDERAPVPE